MANVEHLSKAFEVLDSTDSVPPILCEASDLIRLPPLCLDQVGKQVQSNTSRPLHIKLSSLWDWKLLLSRKKNLRDFKIRRLFLREDVPLPPDRPQASAEI